ncbi:hypothetical protein HFP89_04615 [Wenzhouxiangella sp. XN79A]|nr:hypothetical protein [Wenzhouxiangella sp. XN79A]NKI34444.1 hypothetical protein [Wenzhouxiangella sp. XN79A]
MEIIAFMAAAMALVFAADAQSKVGKLQKRLEEKGLIDDRTARDEDPQ